MSSSTTSREGATSWPGPEFEAELTASRGRLWSLALEVGFLTHPADNAAAIDEATRLLAEADARLISYTESRVAAILRSAR